MASRFIPFGILPSNLPGLGKETGETGVRAIVSRISNLISKSSAAEKIAPQQENKNTSETGISDISAIYLGNDIWRISNDRRAIYRDLHNMDREDSLVSTGLDIIADATTGFEDMEVDGFQWEFRNKSPKAAKALEILEDLNSRLNLGTEAWQIVRNFVKFGEEFREIIVDDDMNIVGFRNLPGETMFPKLDERGNKKPGYYQQPHLNMPQFRIDFEEWQILPFIYGARRGWYGTGLMMPARRSWKRLEKMQDGMAIARLIRAYDKLVHKVPVRSDWQKDRQQKAITDYKKNMTKIEALDGDGNLTLKHNPLTIETDIYIPDDGTNRGGVEMLDAKNTQLWRIEDVEHHQKLLLARIKVPRKFLNLGRGEKGVLTDGSLTAEDVQFARTLRNVQAVLRDGLKKLAWLALFLQGIDANELGLRIRMAKISTMDALMNAKVLFTKAQAAEIYAGILGGLPVHIVATKFMELDEEEQEQLVEFLEEMIDEDNEEDSQPTPSNNGNSSVKPDADGSVRSPSAKRRAMRRGIGKRAGRQIGEKSVPSVQVQKDLNMSPYDYGRILSSFRAVANELEDEKSINRSE